MEGLLTKCKESIKANKQKTTALTEVKESLAKQVSEKEGDLNDVRSQLVNSQATLSTAQKEIESYRNKAQQEELQIAEVKMMMHQVKSALFLSNVVLLKTKGGRHGLDFELQRGCNENLHCGSDFKSFYPGIDYKIFEGFFTEFFMKRDF